MVQEMIFGVAGGLGLFLFGMIQMSEGLKKQPAQNSKTFSNQ